MATKRSAKTSVSSSVPASSSRGMSSASKTTRAPEPGSIAVTHEAISRRAYDIWKSGRGGSDLENWTRAERELRSGR